MEILKFIIGAYLIYLLFIYGAALIITILQTLIKYWYILVILIIILWASL